MKLSNLISGIVAAGLMLSTSILSTSVVAQANISVPKVQNEYDGFAKQVLIQVMGKANFAVKTQEFDRDLSRSGLVESLKHQDIDVAWLPASDSLTEDFIAIKIPVFKGALSYYQIQTKNKQLLQLSHISLADIKQEHIGLLKHDANLQELVKAGLRVSGARTLAGLERMLEGERFDIALKPLFHSSAIDAKSAQNTSKNQVIFAANPYFFTVHQSRPELARAIKIGLEALYQDGSMEQYMDGVPWVANALAQLESGDLQVLKINKPDNALATLNNQYWLEPTSPDLFGALLP